MAPYSRDSLYNVSCRNPLLNHLTLYHFSVRRAKPHLYGRGVGSET
jgi:hypothetical protein